MISLDPASLRASASTRIAQVAATWDGVQSRPHRFGGIEFHIGKREIGHLHGDYLLDIPFPMNVRDTLIASGRVERHHVLPHSGWISLHLHRESDVDDGIALLRLSYDLAIASQQRKRHAENDIRSEEITDGE